MAGVLVSDAEVYGYLGISASDDSQGIALQLRDSLEDLLQQETSQQFGPSQVIVDEAYDGWDTKILYVNKPIKTLDNLKFRYGVDALTDYIVDVVNYVMWTPGKRRLALRHIDYAPTVWFPRGFNNILVSYTTMDNIPPAAKQAVREATATIYRRIGSEDARSEQIGTFQHVLLRSLDESMTWQRAVATLTIPSLG